MSMPRLEIDSQIHENPKKPRNAALIEKQIEFDWTIDTQQGNISFRSVGFRQYVRRKPVFSRNGYGGATNLEFDMSCNGTSGKIKVSTEKERRSQNKWILSLSKWLLSGLIIVAK
jgi:hypothetical protein